MHRRREMSEERTGLHISRHISRDDIPRIQSCSLAPPAAPLSVCFDPQPPSPLKVCDAKSPLPLLAAIDPLIDVLPALVCDVLVVDEAEGLPFRVRSIAHDELVFSAEGRHPRPDGLRVDAHELPGCAAVAHLFHNFVDPVRDPTQQVRGKQALHPQQ